VAGYQRFQDGFQALDRPWWYSRQAALISARLRAL
jgi:hypothetical protein